MSEQPSLERLDRRTAIAWMLAAYATLAVGPFKLGAQTVTQVGRAVGYGRDPVLTKQYGPGDFWPLTFTAEQHRLVSVLCDVIIPAEGVSPSASAVRVPDFIDEWVSAPYEGNVADRALILRGIAWLDDEGTRRFKRRFAELTDTQRQAICDEICHVDRAAPAVRDAAAFFARFRDLVAGGFYTTAEGMKDVGYLGNVPLATFDGPSPELIAMLGL